MGGNEIASVPSLREAIVERPKVVAGGDGTITVYNSDTWAILSQNVNAHASRVNDVAFSPDSSRIASGGADGAVKLWGFGP